MPHLETLDQATKKGWRVSQTAHLDKEDGGWDQLTPSCKDQWRCLVSGSLSVSHSERTHTMVIGESDKHAPAPQRAGQQALSPTGWRAVLTSLVAVSTLSWKPSADWVPVVNPPLMPRAHWSSGLGISKDISEGECQTVWALHPSPSWLSPETVKTSVTTGAGWGSPAVVQSTGRTAANVGTHGKYIKALRYFRMCVCKHVPVCAGVCRHVHVLEGSCRPHGLSVPLPLACFKQTQGGE